MHVNRGNMSERREFEQPNSIGPSNLFIEQNLPLPHRGTVYHVVVAGSSLHASLQVGLTDPRAPATSWHFYHVVVADSFGFRVPNFRNS